MGVALYIWLHGVYPSFWTALRHAAFNLVSIATDCGFVSQDYGAWPMFAPMGMLMLSCYCANTGSTGGGIKMFRTLVLFRQAGRELFLLVHPQAVTPVKIGGQVVANKIVFAVLAFIVLYFGTVVTLTFLLLASGLDFVSSFSAIIACINNAGPGPGRGRPGQQLPGAHGLPDLGLHAAPCCSAAWRSSACCAVHPRRSGASKLRWPSSRTFREDQATERRSGFAILALLAAGDRGRPGGRSSITG